MAVSPAEQPQWYAVCTRFKAEKEVQRLLMKKGIEAYVPLSKVVRQYTRKRKTVELPLIHCYVFVHTQADRFVPVLQTEHVIKFIQFEGRPKPIPAHEIALLKRVCQEVNDLEARPLEYAPGLAVQVVGGNLTGIQGRLVENLGKNFLVELDQIGLGLLLEVDPALLLPLSGASRAAADPHVKPTGAQKYWS